MDKDKMIRLLQQAARGDKEYRAMEASFVKLERTFSEVVAGLTDEQQNIIWKFVFASDELDRRLLEIACEYIDCDKA